VEKEVFPYLEKRRKRKGIFVLVWWEERDKVKRAIAPFLPNGGERKKKGKKDFSGKERGAKVKEGDVFRDRKGGEGKEVFVLKRGGKKRANTKKTFFGKGNRCLLLS